MRPHPTLWLPLLVTLALAQTPSCRSAEPPPGPAEDTPTVTAPHPVIVRPAPGRMVAVGDIHGDLAAARRALQLGGAVDGDGHWIGGELVVVQTGDVLDRGDDERAILDWFEVLEQEAADDGGAFVMLNANHEVMAVGGELSGTTEGALAAFRDLEGLPLDAPAVVAAEEGARHRIAAFQPGAPYALLLSENDVIAQFGETLFVHGGVLPEHVERGLQVYNDETRAWMRGEGKPPAWGKQKDSPVWCRDYSKEPDEQDCDKLEQVLAATGTRRMVVGHTVQKGGISSACDEQVWRIDVGLSRHYGHDPEVLEIVGNQVRVLRVSEEEAAPTPGP